MIGNLISRALPLLNKAIPIGMASQGLSKIDPRFKNFIQSSLASGYTLDAVMGFIRNRLEGTERKENRARLESKRSLRPDEMASKQKLEQGDEPINILQNVAGIGGGIAGGLSGLDEGETQPIQDQTELMNSQNQQRQFPNQQRQLPMPKERLAIGEPPPEEKMNMANPNEPIPMQQKLPSQIELLAQYEPNLAQEIMGDINKGYSPEDIAKHYKSNRSWSSIIKNFEHEIAQNFTDFLRSVTGKKRGMTREEALGAFRQHQLNKMAMEKQQQQSQQGSSVDQALLAAFDKIMKM